MTEGFGDERITEIKENGEAREYGFLKRRLGKRIIYCNRPSPEVLWYERIDNKNIPVEALSFLSKPKEGMVGLKIYAAERWGETAWKMGLFLRGEQNQIVQFECGLHTVFAKGMMWAFCAANAEEVRSGEIGINPMPADPTKSKSKNPEKILYCNVFINGEEMPYFPGGTEYDWRELAIVAMTKCNGYPPDEEEIPDNSFFMTEKQVEKYNKQYGSKPKNQQTQNPAQTQQPARSTAQNVRSGVSHPIQPPNAPRGLQATASSTVEPLTETEEDQEFMTEEEIGIAYSEIMLSLDRAYIVNGKKIDGDRMQKVLDRVGATKFDQLSINIKNQVVCTLALELIESKYPLHSVVSRLRGLAKKAANNEVFKEVTQALLVAFSPNHIIQPDSEIPF